MASLQKMLALCPLLCYSAAAMRQVLDVGTLSTSQWHCCNSDEEKLRQEKVVIEAGIVKNSEAAILSLMDPALDVVLDKGNEIGKWFSSLDGKACDVYCWLDKVNRQCEGVSESFQRVNIEGYYRCNPAYIPNLQGAVVAENDLSRKFVSHQAKFVLAASVVDAWNPELHNISAQGWDFSQKVEKDGVSIAAKLGTGKCTYNLISTNPLTPESLTNGSGSIAGELARAAKKFDNAKNPGTPSNQFKSQYILEHYHVSCPLNSIFWSMEFADKDWLTLIQDIKQQNPVYTLHDRGLSTRLAYGYQRFTVTRFTDWFDEWADSHAKLEVESHPASMHVDYEMLCVRRVNVGSIRCPAQADGKCIRCVLKAGNILPKQTAKAIMLSQVQKGTEIF